MLRGSLFVLCINLLDDCAFQDIMGLRLGAAVATIKRNAQGVITGYRESKTAKAGCSLVRRYEVQVRLSLDNSSVFLYPDQLNVLSSHPHPKQTQPPQVAVLQRVPPHFEKEARTLDSGVVDAAVCSPLSSSIYLFIHHFVGAQHCCRCQSRVRRRRQLHVNATAQGDRVDTHCLALGLITHHPQANPTFRGGPSAFSHDEDNRVALDALELLLRAHDHVFTLRPLFERGDHMPQVFFVFLIIVHVYSCRTLQATIKCS